MLTPELKKKRDECAKKILQTFKNARGGKTVFFYSGKKNFSWEQKKRTDKTTDDLFTNLIMSQVMSLIDFESR